MGLDMFAYRVAKEHAIDPLTIRTQEQGRKGDLEELYYWRKHHDLHGWMEALYHAKGGKCEFNCVPVQLTSEDLQKLKNDITSKILPSTTGFFFGTNPPDDDSNERDLEFIASAETVIKGGDCVYYNSWW